MSAWARRRVASRTAAPSEARPGLSSRHAVLPQAREHKPPLTAKGATGPARRGTGALGCGHPPLGAAPEAHSFGGPLHGVDDRCRLPPIQPRSRENGNRQDDAKTRTTAGAVGSNARSNTASIPLLGRFDSGGHASGGLSQVRLLAALGAGCSTIALVLAPSALALDCPNVAPLR